uniref:Uncharacterized protein n=1 Tax=Eutreptiella gymnastica TaxID=73025 RepID=A0A7S4GK34_9EUGL
MPPAGNLWHLVSSCAPLPTRGRRIGTSQDIDQHCTTFMAAPVSKNAPMACEMGCHLLPPKKTKKNMLHICYGAPAMQAMEDRKPTGGCNGIGDGLEVILEVALEMG